MKRTSWPSLLVVAGLVLVCSGVCSPVGATTKRKVAPKKVTATTAPPIANGRACPSVGRTAPAAGATFECVTTINGPQWWQSGTRANPIKVGVPFRATSKSDGEWEVTVLGRIDDDTARVLSVYTDSNSKNRNPAWPIVSVRLRIRYVGGADFPNGDGLVRMVSYDGVTRTRGPIGRGTWVLPYSKVDGGDPALDDCWTNEGMFAGSQKECVMPYELAPAEVSEFRLAVQVGTEPRVFMNTAADQPPIS